MGSDACEREEGESEISSVMIRELVTTKTALDSSRQQMSKTRGDMHEQVRQRAAACMPPGISSLGIH